MKTLIKILLSVAAVLLGVVDASAFVAADATAGAAAINDTTAGGIQDGSAPAGNARAAVGQDQQGVHATTQANVGITTDAERLGAPGLLDDPIDEIVTKMFQSAVAVDQICRHIQNVKQNGMRYSFWSVDTREIKGTVTGGCAATDALTATIAVDNGNIVDPTDIIVFPGIKGYKPGTNTPTDNIPLCCYVQGVSGNYLTIQSINGQTLTYLGIPAIANDSVFYRLGHAASEGDVQTTPYAALPEPDELYMQIFKTQVMESTISIDSDKKVNWSLSDQNELALYNLRKEIELSYIFGVKNYIRNTVTKRYVYTCAGIIQQIVEKGTVITYDESDPSTDFATEAELLTKIVKPIFLGNSGSATRYMFAGSDFVAKVAGIPNVSRQIGATESLRKFGIDWKTLQFMSWQIECYQHPLLDEVGLSKCAFVLDLPHVRKNVFRSLTQDILELIKAGIFDGKSTVWTEISSIGLKYPKCHAFIREAGQYDPA